MRIVLGNFKIDCLVEQEEKSFKMKVPYEPEYNKDLYKEKVYYSKSEIDKDHKFLKSDKVDYDDILFELSSESSNKIEACDKSHRSYPFLKEFLNWRPGDLGGAFEYLKTYGICWSHENYFMTEYLRFEKVHMCFEFAYQLIRLLRGKKYIKGDGQKSIPAVEDEEMDDIKLFVMLLNFLSWDKFPFYEEFADLKVYENMGRLVIFRMANSRQVFEVMGFGNEKTREGYNGGRWHDHLLGYADLNIYLYTFKTILKTMLEQIPIEINEPFKSNINGDKNEEKLSNSDDDCEKTELECIVEEEETENFCENIERPLELTEDESKRIYNDEKERKNYVRRRLYELSETDYDDGCKEVIPYLHDKVKEGYINRIKLIIDFLKIVKNHYEYIQNNDQQSFEEILYGKKVASEIRLKSVAIDVDEKISFTPDEQETLREIGKSLFQDVFGRLVSYYPMKMSIELSEESDKIAKRIADDELGSCYEIIPFTDNTLGALIHAFIFTVEDERYFRKCQWCGEYFTPPIRHPNAVCCKQECSDKYGKARKKGMYRTGNKKMVRKIGSR